MKTKTAYVRFLRPALFLFLLFNTQFIFAQLLVNTSFEGSNPWAGFDNGQHCCSYSVQQSSTIFHDGTKSFRAEVRASDPAVSSGWRAELVPDYSGGDAGDMWYGFSVYFETPQSGGNWTGSYGGHYIQWHPDNSSGSLSFGLWGSDGYWDLVTNPEGDETAVHHTAPASGGPAMRITANVWHNVVLHVNWSTGVTQFWLNGVLHTNITVPWSSGPGRYLKFGMNRWGNCNNGAPCDTWVIYYDNLKIGRNVTYNDVAPSSATPPPNQLPTANAGSDITLALPNNSTILVGSGTDPDGTIASYQWTKVSNNTGTYTLSAPNAATTTLSNLQAGVYTFRLTVTDNNGATATDNVIVTVNPPPNQPPTANAGSDIMLTLPVNSTTLAGSGTDADGTIATYAWTKVSNNTGTYTLGTPNAGTTTLSNLQAGVYTFRLTVTDNNGATATDNITVTVNAAANQAPTANAGNNITLTLPANSTTLVGSGADADGTIAGYAWTKVSNNTGTYTLGTANAATTTLSNLQAGVYVFRLTVTDNNGTTGTDDVTVTVNPAANQPPTADAGNNITLTLPINNTMLAGSGTDADGTIASYVWTKTSNNAGTYTLGTPNAALTTLSNLQAGVYVFRLTVTDNNGATATDDVTVTVNASAPSNQPPVANAGNNVSLDLPANSTTLNASASFDPDGTIASYAWTNVSGTGTFSIGNANAATTTLSGLQPGVYVFQLRVTDNNGATDDDNITIVVSATANQPPAANAGNNIILTMPLNSTTLNGGASTDADGTIVSYAWTRVGGTGTYSIGNANAAATTLSNLQPGTYVFRLTVTDNDGASSADDVTVTVNAASNQVPTANAGSDITLTWPVSSATLAGSGYDPDGTIATYAWAKVSSNIGTYTLGTPNAAATTLTNLQVGVYVFRLTVTDNSGVSATDNVTVTVNPATNLAPTANAGADITITLPTNTATLYGSGTDADGTIATYLWTKVSSNTGTYTLANTGSAATGLYNLQQGVYVFRLTVTDNNGATATDNVTVTVNAAAVSPNLPPVARTDADMTITLPLNSAQLHGNTSSDPDGVIVSYQWTQSSGPASSLLTNATTSIVNISNLTVGDYVFTLKVTDDDGANTTKTIRLTVQNKPGAGAMMKIYPNPVSGVLNIQYISNSNGKYRVRIYDASRKLLKEEMMEKNQVSIIHTMDMSMYERGIYILEFISPDNEQTTMEIIKM